MSYGGYATGMAMARDVTNIYKCGASVSPVTDWRFANTIATEKFLDLPYPSDQLASYDQASILNKLSNFVNKKYVVFHGTADDTVHYQNSMMLVKGLELLEIPFAQISLPDELHSIKPALSYYVFDYIEKFLIEDCFEIL